MDSRQSTNIVIWLAVLFSAISSVFLGLDVSFSVYAVELKRTFRFTQYQVEVVASTGTVGMGLIFLETVITDMCGYLATYVVTWIVLPLSTGLMSLAAAHTSYFYERPTAVYIIHLALASGITMAETVIGRVLLQILPREHTGKLISLIFAMNSLGKAAYGAEMSLFFQDNLVGFFLTSTVTFAVVLGVSYPLLYLARRSSPLTDKPGYDNINEETSQNLGSEQDDSSFKHLLSSAYFHSTFWPSVTVNACTFTCMNNITSIAVSAGMKDSITTVYLLSAFITASRLGAGVVFDRFQCDTCGFLLLLLSFLSFATGAALGLLSNDVGIVVLVTVFVGIGNGPINVISISMLVRRFGAKHYSRISALFFGTLAASQSLIQCFSGYLYDVEIKQEDRKGIFCYGKACFFWSFFTMLVLTLISTLVQTINWRITLRNKYNTN